MVEHALGLDFASAVEFITGEKQIAAPTRAATDKRPKSLVADKPDGRAPWLWRQRRPVADGSPPWTYLRQARGFTGAVPATLGYLPPRDGYPPSMIAAYGLASEPEPGLLAISRRRRPGRACATRLAPDGIGKAGGKDDKITIGSPLGSPIVLAPPNDGLGLAITEGIEDGLSIHVATGLRRLGVGLRPLHASARRRGSGMDRLRNRRRRSRRSRRTLRERTCLETQGSRLRYAADVPRGGASA